MAEKIIEFGHTKISMLRPLAKFRILNSVSTLGEFLQIEVRTLWEHSIFVRKCKAIPNNVSLLLSTNSFGFSTLSNWKEEVWKNQAFNGIRTRENLLRWSFFTLIYHCSSHMNYFIYTSRHFTPHGRYELNKLTSLPMCGFIAQLVEHRTGIAEVTGSNPVDALIFFFFSGFFFPIA